MIDISPSDLAVRNARVGEPYVLLCSLKNETELILDCKIQTSQSCSDRWTVAPKAFRMKPRQTQSVELKLNMRHLPSTAARRSMAVGGLKDLFYLKTQYFEQRFHVLVYGDNKGSAGGRGKVASTSASEGPETDLGGWKKSKLESGPPAVDVEAGLHRLGQRVMDLEAREQALQILVSQQEKLVKDKDEVILMLQSHLQLSKRGGLGVEEGAMAKAGPREAGRGVSKEWPKDGEAQEIASVLGANAKLRAKVTELALKVEDQENELSVTQEALKSISADEPKVEALVKAAVERERAEHESRNKKVVEMFSLKASKISQLEASLEEADAVNREKTDLIVEFKTQLQSMEAKVVELLEEKQALHKENFALKAENLSLVQYKPSSAKRALEHQLERSKEMNERLSSKLREKQALEDFSSVKNQSLSESVRELEKSLAEVAATNADKMRSKDLEISLLTQRINHSEALLGIQRTKEGPGEVPSQDAPTSQRQQSEAKATTASSSDNLEEMLELKQKEVSRLKAKLKKLETIHEKAKQTAINSENKLKEVMQKNKSGAGSQKYREEAKDLKIKLQNVSRDCQLKVEQKESLLRVEKAKTSGLTQELAKEREKSAMAATAFSGTEEREAMERKMEASSSALKECQDSLQVVHAKYVKSEKERREVEATHRNYKAEMTRNLSHAEQKVRTAELHSQQHIKDLESTIRTLSGRSVSHKEIAAAKSQVASLTRELENLRSDNNFLNKQISLCEQRLGVTQSELQARLSYGDLKEFKDVYGKYISESVAIVELSKRLQEVELELREAKEKVAESASDARWPQTSRVTESKGTMVEIIRNEKVEASMTEEARAASLQEKLEQLSLYTAKLTEQLVSKEKEVAAIKDDLLLVKSRKDTASGDWMEPLPDQYISLGKLRQVQKSKNEAEARVQKMEEKVSLIERQTLQREDEMKEEKARLCKKLEESRMAEMETQRLLTERSCALEEKSVQLKILKEALKALKLGYTANPCDEDHILLVAKVASAEAKDLAHQRHVENLSHELDLRFQVIKEMQGELSGLREDVENSQVEAKSEREMYAEADKRLKAARVELESLRDDKIALESKVHFHQDRYSKLRMELDVEKQVVFTQRKRHFELIAAERRSIIQELERFKVEQCNICESSRKITRFITDYDDVITALASMLGQPAESEADKLESCLSSMKYLGLEASKLFASTQTSVHILSTESEILRSKVNDLELKNECLTDKLFLAESMNVSLTESFKSRSKMIYTLIQDGGKQSEERIRGLSSELEAVQLQVLTERRKKNQNLVKGKVLEQKYLQLKCEVEAVRAEKEAETPLPDVLGADLSSLVSESESADPSTIAQTVKFKLLESHLVQKVVLSNKQAESARTQLQELSTSYRDLAEKIARYRPGESAGEGDLRLEAHFKAELTLKAKENFELSQKLKHLSIEMSLQKNETLIATRKAEALEGNLKNSLKTLDAALIQQRQEQEEIVSSVIEETRAEVAMTYDAIYATVKASRESTQECKELLLEDFKQMRGAAKDHSIQALANLSYLDIEGMPVVKVSDLRGLKMQKKLLEQENEKLLSRLETKEKEVLELTEDVESQKLALRDLSNTFSKSAFKKMHSGGMLKSTISTLNKKLVECKLVQADMQRKMKISARAELELRQLLHSREQRLTMLNTEVRAYNQALDSIQKFAAKEKNLEFKRILREVVLKLSTVKSNSDDDDDAIPSWDSGSHTNVKVDVRLGVFAGLRIQMAEKNARISHLEQKLSEHLATTPVKPEAPRDQEADRDMYREISNLNNLLKEAISGAISKITKELRVDLKSNTLDEAIEILLDKVRHTEVMLNKSQAKTKVLRGKMKDTKTEEANASLQNAVKGLSDKCRPLVMEKAEIKLERDRLLERHNALKASASKNAKESSKHTPLSKRRVLMKKPVRVLGSAVKDAGSKSASSQAADEAEGGLSSQFEQIDSFADMIVVHLTAIQDFVGKSLDPYARQDMESVTNVEEDFSSVGSLVCIIKDTLKILASEVSESGGASLPSKPSMPSMPSDKKSDQGKKREHKESEWEVKYSSLKQAYTTYRKSSKVEMNALKEKNMNASAQVIEAAKDKVSMQAELREMQKMVERGISDIETQQKSRSKLTLRLTEREAQLRIAKTKAKVSEGEAQARVEELQKVLKKAEGDITSEREERAKVLAILRKAVNDLKTQLHIEFDLRNQLYSLELEKKNAVNSFENKENELNSEMKNREVTQTKITELEESLVQERQQSHKLKVRYEYMREGLKQLEIRFNAADKHRVMLERCVQMKLNEADKIADSLSVVDFGKAPMMILLEVQEIEKLISKMSLEIQKSQKAKEVSSDKWKYTSALVRFKRTITEWKKSEKVRLKKKITDLRAKCNRLQNQNMDLVLCSEKAADTIGNLQGVIAGLERDKKSMAKSLDGVREMYSVEMTNLRIQTKTEAVLEQHHIVEALTQDLVQTEKELESLKSDFASLKTAVKVDAKKIISEFHETSEASKKEILGMMSSLEKLIPGLKSSLKGGGPSKERKPPKSPLRKKSAISGSDFTSEAIQKIQELEGSESAGNLELKLRLQCQLTRKVEKVASKLKAEVQTLKQELKQVEKKYEGYPSRTALDLQEKSLAECKKSLKESRSLCTIRLKEIRALKEDLTQAKDASAEAKLSSALDQLDTLQRKVREASLSIQRKDAIIADLRQNVKDLQDQDLTDKWTKTEAKNKQLALTVQRQSVSIRELRSSVSQTSKSLESALKKEKADKTTTDLQKKYRGDLKRKDEIISQMTKTLGQLQDELSESLSRIEESGKREVVTRKSAEHDWITFKSFMKSAIGAVEKMSKIVVQSSNEIHGVVQAVEKAEKIRKMEAGSAKTIARLVDMSTSEVEDILRVDPEQTSKESLETYLIRMFKDMNTSVDNIHRANVMKGKDKFVSSWDPSVLTSVAEILEKEFIQVRALLSASLKALPEAVAKQPKRKAQGTKPKAAAKKPAASTKASGGASTSAGRKSDRDVLMDELAILAKRVKK